jgi:hypothetical protein
MKYAVPGIAVREAQGDRRTPLMRDVPLREEDLHGLPERMDRCVFLSLPLLIAHLVAIEMDLETGVTSSR